jgi:hypothetical protein
MIYHVLNRGNGRMRIFHKAGDYEAFERVLAEGLKRYPVELPTVAALHAMRAGRRPPVAWLGGPESESVC